MMTHNCNLQTSREAGGSHQNAARQHAGLHAICCFECHSLTGYVASIWHNAEEYILIVLYVTVYKET